MMQVRRGGGPAHDFKRFCERSAEEGVRSRCIVLDLSRLTHCRGFLLNFMHGRGELDRASHHFCALVGRCHHLHVARLQQSAGGVQADVLVWARHRADYVGINGVLFAHFSGICDMSCWNWYASICSSCFLLCWCGRGGGGSPAECEARRTCIEMRTKKRLAVIVASSNHHRHTRKQQVAAAHQPGIERAWLQDHGHGAEARCPTHAAHQPGLASLYQDHGHGAGARCPTHAAHQPGLGWLWQDHGHGASARCPTHAAHQPGLELAWLTSTSS